MNIKQVAFLAFTMAGKIGWSQNTNINYKRAIKFYNLTTIEDQTRSIRLNSTSASRYQYTSNTFQILHPTIAFQWASKKSNFHEIELTRLMLGKTSTKTEIVNDSTNNTQTLSSGNLLTTVIAARYEYILTFNKSKERQFVPSIGFAIHPYYHQNNYSPTNPNALPTSDLSIGLKSFVIPRITYFVTSKFFIDVNIPLCFFDTYYSSYQENNPVIPIQDRTTNSFNFSGFPKFFSGRLGIGVKL